MAGHRDEDREQDTTAPAARRSIVSLARFAGFVLFVAALVRELRAPSDERTWHGRIGFVPYDLRPPTPARVRAAWWNPDDQRLLTPRVFGVGWSVNLARLWAAVRRDT